MAFGSLVMEGYPVRLSGQDSGRGTFSQRHALMYDTQTGAVWSPLGELRSETNPARKFYVFDSSLSENGVLGFEYGYSVIAPDALVMWEAQFGDFSNGAQVIIDQYIAASEDKWKQKCRLVDAAAARLRRPGTGTFSRAAGTIICSFARKIICRFATRQRRRSISICFAGRSSRKSFAR